MLKFKLISNFISTSEKFKNRCNNEKNASNFEQYTNEYLLKNQSSIKLLKLENFTSIYKSTINLLVLNFNQLKNLELNGKFRLSELNKLLTSTEFLIVLKLLEVEIVDDISYLSNSSYIKLPQTLIELKIYNLIWYNNPKQTLINKEEGVYQFGTALALPKLNLLSVNVTTDQGENNLLNYLLKSAPNLIELRGEINLFNSITFELLYNKCASLTRLKLVFTAEYPIKTETLYSYEYTSKSELSSLLGSVCHNSLRTYLTCKACPNLKKLSLEWEIIDIENLSILLPLLPNVKKLTIFSYFKQININKLKFNNLTINHLTLSSLESVYLLELINCLKDWTCLKRISILLDGDSEIIDVGQYKVLEHTLKPWKLFVYINSIQIWQE